jgi:hypothetical protein
VILPVVAADDLAAQGAIMPLPEPSVQRARAIERQSRAPPHKMRSLRVVQTPNPTRVRCMRVFNFSAGPAVLPEVLLQKGAGEMLDWHDSGMSVMEMSRRDKEFISIADTAEADLRTLLQTLDGVVSRTACGRSWPVERAARRAFALVSKAAAHKQMVLSSEGDIDF